ncbi:hypothetical protein DAEQUDRAFT_727378 [Daedalea quercina L-15889]|uniref:Uncharacterized protein n=1 Tax=Daedalea quercina L-15889 TaxID=1314783 RepID=A0A165Q322_9APHY|nr:hypothetical protein DAEQUDRAFT_727378 [Daedalea quercina L-15889]
MLSQVPDASSKREKSQAPEQRPCSHVVVSAPNEHKAPHVQRKADAGLQRPTFTTRVKGFFYSYLPVASGSKTHTVKKPQPTQPGLPVPPPETFAKPRPPIHTPASKPIPKPVPPKDTIQLNSVLPPKPSRIPRSKEPPRRLVELHPLPPPPSENLLRVNPPGNRRSSGGSVKDLILTFEGLGESRNSRPSSVASHRGGSKLKERPLWRP